MDIKGHYRSLIDRIRKEIIRDGEYLSLDKIAEDLGYSRAYLERFVGVDSHATKEHIRILLKHYPELLAKKFLIYLGVKHNPNMLSWHEVFP